MNIVSHQMAMVSTLHLIEKEELTITNVTNGVFADRQKLKNNPRMIHKTML